MRSRAVVTARILPRRNHCVVAVASRHKYLVSGDRRALVQPRYIRIAAYVIIRRFCYRVCPSFIWYFFLSVTTTNEL
jgi:hypothetical protein